MFEDLFRDWQFLNLKAWWREEEEISLLQKLSRFIGKVLLVQFPNERLFIFIYQYLAASQEWDRREVEMRLDAERAKEVEARLALEQKRLAQEKKSSRRQRFLLCVVSMKMLLTGGLWLSIYYQYRQAAKSEIKAIAKSSDALSASNRRLDALVEAIRAKRQLQKLGRVDAECNLNLDLVAYGCNWVPDYLQTNAKVDKSVSVAPGQEARHLCDGVQP